VRPFDENGAFRQTVADEHIRSRSVRGAGVTVFTGGFTLGVQMIATVVLARLLSPTDFGLVAMVTTFSLLLINFGLNGFTDAIIQRESIDHGLVSNLFWINVGAGAVLTVGFAAGGSLLAHFFHDGRVRSIAAAMSATIFCTTLSVQHLALLKRAMRFSVVSLNDIIGRALSVAVSILLGWLGWGYWALVAGAIAQSIAMFVGAWTLCRWVPSLPRRVAGTGSMVKFAMNAYGRFIANYCTWNTDNLLVGWRFGPVSLGYYKKAYDLFALPASQLVTPLAGVAVSALSRLKRDAVQYRRYFLSALRVIAFVGMAVGADLTLVGHDVIRLLLGPKWDESGRIFVYFGPGIGVMLLYYTNGWIHVSLGRADRWLRWGLVEFAGTVLLFIAGLRWGAPGIALAWTASFWILTWPGFWYAGQPIQLSVWSVMGAVWRFVCASVVAGIAATAIMRPAATLMPSGWAGAATHMVLTSSLFLVLYLGAVVVLHGGYSPLQQLFRLMLEMLPLEKFFRRSPGRPAIEGAEPVLAGYGEKEAAL
jgi:O-antigen/teichoic acid export membrane protein